MISKEYGRLRYSPIRCALRGNRMGAIHTVQVQRDGVWTDAVDKQEVE